MPEPAVAAPSLRAASFNDVAGRIGSAVGAGLAFEDVSLVYPDGTHALANIDLIVAPGEFVSLVGPSGCGKSTVLRLASGLLAPTTGSIAVEVDQLGYVFQDPTLMPWRSVMANVELLAELHGIGKAERRRLAQAAIDLVGLTGFESHLPARLSGGMRMRTSLARSLTLNPKVFLFDEPFGALDEISRGRLNDELSRLFDQRHFAGVFVTHSVQEAVYLSTRVVVMSPRPGGIAATFEVPLPVPRDPEMRFDPVFTEIAHHVSRVLKESS
ncbi:MAG: ABC transporter ATP-binding protein [Acidimicrobiaceae bacterium]|nr:ABC transporter ATP-binding protein [Acidimicrobiaceae bacterium]